MHRKCTELYFCQCQYELIILPHKVAVCLVRDICVLKHLPRTMTWRSALQLRTLEATEKSAICAGHVTVEVAVVLIVGAEHGVLSLFGVFEMQDI